MKHNLSCSGGPGVVSVKAQSMGHVVHSSAIGA
jgi:hypothetical protein